MPSRYKIDEIEGIGPAYRVKLESVGIYTTENLLARASRPKDRSLLSEQTGISDSQILRWCNQADLMRISGVGRQYAELLEATGCDTVKELAQRNADNLLAKMKEVNEARRLSRSTPSISLVKRWVERARLTRPVVTT